MCVKEFGKLYDEGYTFALIRGYRSNGKVDDNVVSNIKNANTGRMKFVDVYIFPCQKCGDPAGQADSLVEAIKGLNYRYVWVDVEDDQGKYWTSDKEKNKEFITSMVDKLEELDQRVGIYTNKNNWQTIVGLDWTNYSHLPLWYSHYDDVQSFRDFKAFGGWYTPYIKHLLKM